MIEPIRRFQHRAGSFAVLALLFISAASSSAQVKIAQGNAPALAKGLALAGPDRPANVPANFVITPFGYFHPSCVFRIEEGETLLGDGRVEHVNGAVDAQVPVCAYPHYTHSGSPIAADAGERSAADATNDAQAGAGHNPSFSGWLEYVDTTTTNWYDEITATWTVPPQPEVTKYPTIFFFPGFEDYNNVLSIVQPVLQWYSPGPWMVASWNCCMQGTVYESRPQKASPGDTIVGTIMQMCKKGSGFCQEWKVVTENQTTGHTTALRKTPLAGQVWNWAFGAVLEVYGVTQCGNFPADSSLTMTVELYDQNRNLIADPGWTGVPAPSGTDPSCPYGLGITPNEETLEY